MWLKLAWIVLRAEHRLNNSILLWHIVYFTMSCLPEDWHSERVRSSWGMAWSLIWQFWKPAQDLQASNLQSLFGPENDGQWSMVMSFSSKLKKKKKKNIKQQNMVIFHGHQFPRKPAENWCSMFHDFHPSGPVPPGYWDPPQRPPAAWTAPPAVLSTGETNMWWFKCPASIADL